MTRYVVTTTFVVPDDVEQPDVQLEVDLAFEDASTPLCDWERTVTFVRPDDLKVEAFPRTDGRWAWHAKDASNGQIMATDGGQGYEHRGDCASGAYRVTGVGPVFLDAEPVAREVTPPGTDTGEL